MYLDCCHSQHWKISVTICISYGTFHQFCHLVDPSLIPLHDLDKPEYCYHRNPSKVLPTLSHPDRMIDCTFNSKSITITVFIVSSSIISYQHHYNYFFGCGIVIHCYHHNHYHYQTLIGRHSNHTFIIDFTISNTITELPYPSPQCPTAVLNPSHCYQYHLL